MTDARYYRLRHADWSADEQALTGVRDTVFVQEQGVPLALELDEHDPGCNHILAEDTAGNPVATARMCHAGHIGRMAVLPDWRGCGIGSALLTMLMEVAREQGLSEVHLNAQTQAAGFYTRFGFEPCGKEFQDAGIPHCKMVCRL